MTEILSPLEKRRRTVKQIGMKLLANPEQVLEAAVYGGLAYTGYKKIPDPCPWYLKLLWGPIGLKLATSSGGTGDMGFTIFGTGVELPCNSQIAGLAMLATLGFACMPWVNDFVENRNVLLDAGRDSANVNVEANAARQQTEWTQGEKDTLLAMQIELGKLQIQGIYGGYDYEGTLAEQIIVQTENIRLYIERINALHAGTTP